MLSAFVSIRWHVLCTAIVRLLPRYSGRFEAEEDGSDWTHIVVGSTVVRSVICVVDKLVAMTVKKLLVMVVELVRGRIDLTFIVQVISI